MVEVGKTRRGGLLDLLLEGVEPHAASGALERGIGVVTGAPSWIIGSLKGNLKFAAWLKILFEELKPEVDRILRTTSPEERCRIVWDAVKRAKDKYHRLTPEEIERIGTSVISNIRKIAEEIRTVLGPVREVLEIALGVVGRG